MAEGVRARIKAVKDSKSPGITLKIEWVLVGPGEVVEKILGYEEFTLDANKPECAYITRGVCSYLQEVSKGSFWQDEKGCRHFFVIAEPGEVPLTLESLSVE